MIELKDVESWKRAIDAISSFISEGNLRFNDEGISLKAVDPSQIVLVNFFMKKASFEKFKVEPTLVGLDLVEFSRIMARAMPGDKMVLNLKESELEINLEGEISRSFALPLIDVADEEVKMPSPNFDATVEITGKTLREALKDASLFGSSVVFRVKEGQMLLEARGSSGTLHSVAKQAKSLSIKSKSEVVSKYSLNFLQNIVKDSSPDLKILLELTNEAPMRVSYKLGPAEIEFYLAHMIL